MKLLFIAVSIIFFGFISSSDRPVHIFMIGDSTMANKPLEGNPERGWGQLLPLFFTNKVKIDNHAQNGRSSKSFINEGRWQKVLDSLQKGDYVIIQFGHNDEKDKDSTRFTSPQTTFKANLTKFVNETRAKGAFPVLCTSIVRRKFENDKLMDTHGEYITVVRELARQLNVPLLDMEQKTAKLVSGLGPEKSKELFVWVEPGQYKAIPEGRKDDTHLNESGATKVAALAVEAMKENKLEIVKYLKIN